MTIDPAAWETLEAGPAVGGSTRLRIHPASPRDLFLSVLKPGLRRRLILEADALPADVEDDLRDTKGIRVVVDDIEGGRRGLVVELTDRLFAPVFHPLVADIAGLAAKAPDDATAARDMLLRLEYWRRLLRDLDSGGMSRTRRRGLAGELHVLLDVLIAGGVDASSAVRAWTGPLAANQDFQFPHGAIEVKATTAKKPQALVITNERELDAKGAGALFLVAVSLDERQGGHGRSLNHLAADVRAAITDPAAAQTFDERLAAYGYLAPHADQYDEPRYTVRDTAAWTVRDAFPRIVEADLPDGVGDVQYRIVTAGLAEYAVDPTAVGPAVHGTNP